MQPDDSFSSDVNIRFLFHSCHKLFFNSTILSYSLTLQNELPENKGILRYTLIHIHVAGQCK